MNIEGKKKKRTRIPQENKVRALLQKKINSICPFCPSTEVGHFQIHHIDGNPSNNEMNNLLLVCPTCHSKITKGDISRKEVINVMRGSMKAGNTIKSQQTFFINKILAPTVRGDNNKVFFKADRVQSRNITPFTKAEERVFTYFEKSFDKDLILEVNLEEESSNIFSLTAETQYYSLSLIDLIVELVRESSMGKRVINIKLNIEGLTINMILYSYINDLTRKELKKKKYRIANILLREFPYIDLRGAKLITMPNANSIVLTEKMFRFYYWLKYKGMAKSGLELSLLEKKEYNRKRKSKIK